MSISTGKYDLDLGLDHWLTFTYWKPDRILNPQWNHLPDAIIGGIITHNNFICEGSIWFDCQQVRECFNHHPKWTITPGVLESKCWDKLTCSPSFLCHCGDHGYITNGKWVSA